MKKVYVIAAKRTAIGKFLGSLSGFSPAELGSSVIKSILNDTNIDSSKIDEVIVGNVLSAGQKQGVARQISVKAGIPVEIPAYGINMICGSGLKAVMNAYTSIASGMSNLIIAGGAESMSSAGFVLPSSVRNGHKMMDIIVADHMVCDGLTDAFENIHMGITAENIAAKYSISREAQDAFSFASQQKAIKAIDAGMFKGEIVPIEIKSKKETILFDTDEFPNRASNLDKLAALKPAFKKDGTVTAGNASGLNDGAAFLMLASQEFVEANNITPLCEIVSVGQGGVDPSIMGMGPVPAIKNALKAGGFKLSDMDIIELNEAFAAQSLGVVKQLCDDHGVDKKWFDERTNLNGGAIALGHPIGASGCRIAVSLIHELKRSGKDLGLASLCIGGGMGCALIVKKI